MFLGGFQGVVAGIWVNLWKLVEGPLRQMVLYFEGIYPKKRKIGFT